MKESNFFKASIYILMAFFNLAIFGILLKVSSAQNGSLWPTFIAFSTSVFFMLPYVFYKGINFLKTDKLSLHVRRSVFGLGATMLYTIALNEIPIVNATLLFNTSPLFIPIISIIWLREKTTWAVWQAIILGFIGIIFIIKPNLLLFTHAGNLIGLCSGILLAIAFLLVKKLSLTEPSMRTVFYFLLFSAFLLIPFLFFEELPNLENCLLASLGGICMIFTQSFLVEGYKYGEPSEVGIYQYSSVVFVGILNWIIWGIAPNILDCLGILLVVSGAYLIIQNKQQSEAAVSAE